MATSHPTWSGSPEQRIIRELRETRVGGLAPGQNSVEYGRFIETVLTRELQLVAKMRSDIELRFARGYIVEDYGDPESGEVSLNESDSAEKAGPRFDIVCYHGNVAWSAFDRVPAAVVPESLACGVIEVKRTISPKRFGPDSNEHFNEQLRNQRDYLDGFKVDIPHIAVGAHFFGTPKENRRKALVDHVALLWDLNNDSSDAALARNGELATVIDILTGENSPNSMDEKTKNLQDIASQLTEDDSDDEPD